MWLDAVEWRGGSGDMHVAKGSLGLSVVFVVVDISLLQSFISTNARSSRQNSSRETESDIGLSARARSIEATRQ